MIYQEILEKTDQLDRVHQDRLKCRFGCWDCCIDGIGVYEIEADYIRYHYPDLSKSGYSSPEGKCVFLDEKEGCRIYCHRPYVCRTQGYPLRWLNETENGDLVEYRDICPLNDTGIPVEKLPEDQCWTLGPVESKLADLQTEWGHGNMKRIRLRDLFDKIETGKI